MMDGKLSKMKITHSSLLVAFFFLTFVEGVCSGEIKRVEGIARVTIGSNATEVQAIEVAKILAERNACEKAGVYIESASEVKNGVLTKDILTSFSAQIVKEVSFTYNKELISGVVYLEGKGNYDIDLTTFYNKVKQVTSENKLRAELQSYVQKYNDLLMMIKRSQSYEARKKMLSEYRSLKEKSQEIFIRHELELTKLRIKNLKQEFHDKLKEMCLYVQENSDIYIGNKVIKQDRIVVNIKGNLIYDEKYDLELKEIVDFGIQTGYLCEKNERNQIITARLLDFFDFQTNPIFFLNTYDCENRLLHSSPIPLFLIKFETRMGRKIRAIGNGYNETFTCFSHGVQVGPFGRMRGCFTPKASFAFREWAGSFDIGMTLPNRDDICVVRIEKGIKMEGSSNCQSSQI